MKSLYGKLYGERLWERVFWASVLLTVLFFTFATLGFLVHPEGLPGSQNPLYGRETSGDAAVLTARIFFCKMLSVTVIVLASLIGVKESGSTVVLSFGYPAFYSLVCVNAVVLGARFFPVETEETTLAGLMIRAFDLAHGSGLWGTAGQLLIACAAARVATSRAGTSSACVAKGIRRMKLSPREGAAYATGILLILIGASVESAVLVA